MALEYLVLFVAGIALLIKSSDFFVDAAAKIAKIFGVSDLVIGLTIVAIGTSLPELAASVFAVFTGEPNLALGTVVGSNISNIALILGITAIVVGTIKIDRKALEKDLFIMLFVSVLFFYFAIDGTISFGEGSVLVILFVLYTLFLFGFMRRFEEIFSYDRFLKQFFGTEKFSVFNLRTYFIVLKKGLDPATYKELLGFDGKEFRKKIGGRIDKGERKEAQQIFSKEFLLSFFNQVLLLCISGVGVFYGAQILIEGAKGIAFYFSIPSSIVGLVMVALGTSLPELGVSLSSARKGYNDILIGNLVGSNIANILLVAGTAAIVAPIVFSLSQILLPIFFMLTISIALAISIRLNYDVTRQEALFFFAIYGAFLYFVYLGLG